ncbi:MAG: vWA domain-containing protein [Planctomycetota bacterium]
MPDFTSNNTSSSSTVESAIEATLFVPTWLWILFCVGILSFSIFVYASDRGLNKNLTRATFAGLRFGVLFLIAWMMLGWYWYRYEAEKPNLIVVIDVSESMRTKDVDIKRETAWGRLEAVQRMFAGLDRSEKERLATSYSLQWYSIAEDWKQETVSPLEISAEAFWEATGKQSRLGESLTQIVDQFQGESAIVLLCSDGINTAGPGLKEPAKVARAAAIPIYALTLGKDFALPDLRLRDLMIESDAYLGDLVTAEVSLIASNFSEDRVEVTLLDSDSGKTLDRTEVDLNQQNVQSNIKLTFVPDHVGEIPLEIRASPLLGESDLSNNSLTTSIQVQNRAIKVLLVQGSPSYEFRFLKHFLQRSQQVETATNRDPDSAKAFELMSVLQQSDSSYVNQDASAIRLVPSSREKLESVDVFVFGQMDPGLISRRSQQIIYEMVTQNGAGCVFLWGDDDPAAAFSDWPLGDLLPVQSGMAQGASVRTFAGSNAFYRWQPTPIGNSTLPLLLESSEQGADQLWEQLPRFRRLGTIGNIKPGAQILVTAEADAQVVSEYNKQPLLLTQFAGAGRSVLQLTDETYRWTSFRGTDTYYQRYWGQLLRWASRGRLMQQITESELLAEPSRIQSGQSLRLQARIGADTAQNNLPASARVLITGVEKGQQSLTLGQSTREERLYSSDVQDLPPGQYTALLVQPNTTPPASTEFSVSAPPGEQFNLTADLEAMQDLARQTRGKSYRPHQFEKMIEELPTGNRTRVDSLPPISLWNSGWIALLFVTLLSCEWILRRKHKLP